MPHYVASDLGLHFLPNTPLGVSSIKRVNGIQIFYVYIYRISLFKLHHTENLEINRATGKLFLGDGQGLPVVSSLTAWRQLDVISL